MKPARRLTGIARLLSAGLIAGSIFGTASTASAAPACQVQPCLTPLIGSPDLTVGVTATPNPVAAGGTHTYTLRVTNITWGSTSRLFAPRPVRGADLTNVRVHLNAYPSNERLLSYHDDTGTGFVCYTPAEYFGMDVRCVSGSVPTLSTSQITLTMQAPSAGAYTATATVDPYAEIAESNEGNNTASVSFSAN
jgi:hypothetical protein